MSLLIPDTGLLFWMILSFGIAFFILARFGFPVILKGVEKRNEFIAQSVESAKGANAKLASIGNECQTLLARAKQQQASILNDTVQEKERILKEAKEKAEKETQLAIDSVMRQIEFEKNKAIRDVREEIATLSVAVAEKIIRGKIEKESGQKEVISRLIDEITLSKS